MDIKVTSVLCYVTQKKKKSEEIFMRVTSRSIDIEIKSVISIYIHFAHIIFISIGKKGQFVYLFISLQFLYDPFYTKNVTYFVQGVMWLCHHSKYFSIN